MGNMQLLSSLPVFFFIISVVFYSLPPVSARSQSTQLQIHPYYDCDFQNDSFPGRLVAGETNPGRHVARDKLKGKARQGFVPGRLSRATWWGLHCFRQTIKCHGGLLSRASPGKVSARSQSSPPWHIDLETYLNFYKSTQPSLFHRTLGKTKNLVRLRSFPFTVPADLETYQNSAPETNQKQL
ncbi:hypothetical protein Tco_1472992, partial [Tanacetum coccineum]